MLRKNYVTSFVALLAFSSFLGCGPNPGMYEERALKFEQPMENEKGEVNAKKEKDMDLGANDSQNFKLKTVKFKKVKPLIPVFQHPWIWDVDLSPVAYEIPVSPFHHVVDYVHPFYAYSPLNPYLYYDWYW